jgi:hypothetical protein
MTKPKLVMASTRSTASVGSHAPSTPQKPEGEEKAHGRRGKFKKASNMKYALMVSNKIEDKLLRIERGKEWTQEDAYSAYDECLRQVLAKRRAALGLKAIFAWETTFY